MRRITHILILSGFMISAFLTEATAGPSTQNQTPPYRIANSLGACFCPSNHMNAVFSSRLELEAMLAAAPCTSRGDGADERAMAWSERCWKAVADSGIDFETDALVYLSRFFSSGMIKGSLAISGPEDGLLTVEIRRHQPKGPLTPDLGFFGSAMVIDKTRIRQIRTEDGRGNQIYLSIVGLNH